MVCHLLSAFVLASTIIITGVASLKPTTTDYGKLWKHLFDDRSSDLRPVANVSEKIIVKIELVPIQILELNIAEERMKTQAWIRLRWMDRSLAWKPEDFGNITKVAAPTKKIWIPDVELFNSISDDFNTEYHVKAMIYNDGLVEWTPPANLESSCTVDVTFFPFDTQYCQLHFGLWTHPTDMLDIELAHEDADVSHLSAPDDWKIHSWKGRKEQRNYLSHLHGQNRTFGEIVYTLKSERYFVQGFLNYITPGVCILLLTLMVFMVPADCGEKMGLAVTALLTLVVAMELIKQATPPVADYKRTPVLTRFFSVALIEIVFSCLISCIVLRCNHHDPSMQPKMNAIFRVIFLQILPGLMRIPCPGEVNPPNLFKRSTWKRQKVTEAEESLESGDSDEEALEMQAMSKRKRFKTRVTSVSDNFTEYQKTEMVALMAIRDLVDTLSKEVKKMNRSTLEAGVDDARVTQWKFAGMVLDTFFFYTSILSMIVMSALTIFSIPNIGHILWTVMTEFLN